MKYYTIQPFKNLADLIQFFWIFVGDASTSDPFIFRTMANGFPEMIFHYKGRFEEVLANKDLAPAFQSGIHGQTNQYRDFMVKEDYGIIGVHFFPYALKTFFGIPAPEFLNQLPDLRSVMKTTEMHLHERVLNAKSNEERISLISEFLGSKIKETVSPAIVFAVKRIVQKNGVLNIKDLAEECNLCQRQFERKFKDSTSFAPKFFSRIIRFNALLNSADYPKKSLTEIALDFGYFDQSHFINEFQEFSGQNPKAYFSEVRI